MPPRDFTPARRAEAWRAAGIEHSSAVDTGCRAAPRSASYGHATPSPCRAQFDAAVAAAAASLPPCRHISFHFRRLSRHYVAARRYDYATALPYQLLAAEAKMPPRDVMPPLLILSFMPIDADIRLTPLLPR